MVWINFIEWLQQQDTLTLIIALGIIVYLIYKGTIQLPFLKINKNKNPHINCKNYPELKHRLSRLMEIKTEQDRKINIEILKDQMAIVDQTAYAIRNKMEKLFYNLLCKNFPEEFNNGNTAVEYKAFENITKSSEAVIKDILRFTMKENHMPTNEAEFLLYASEKAKNIVDHVSDDLDIRWHKGLRIKRNEYRKACFGELENFKDLSNQIKDILIKTIRKCRNIYEESIYEIQRYDNEAAVLFPDIYRNVKYNKKEKE